MPTRPLKVHAIRQPVLCAFVGWPLAAFGTCETNHTARDCIISHEATKSRSHEEGLPAPLYYADHLAFYPNPAILNFMNALSPIVSEFETLEQAEAYEAWLRAKVSASLSDGKPTIAHDMAMAQVRKIIDDKRAAETRLAR